MPPRTISQELQKTVLMVADMPTQDGRIYSRVLCDWLVERFTKNPPIIIQEMSTEERRLKKIPLAEPWMQRAMAEIIGGEMVGNNLVIYFKTNTKRDGKKLASVIKQLGFDGLEFFPIGYGEVGDGGVVKPGYQLNYVAVEIKNG